MITAAISFLASSAGGALVGTVLEWFTSRREAQAEERKAKHEEDLASRKCLKEYLEATERQSKPVLVPYSCSILWGLYKASGEKKTTIRSPRSYIVPACIFMLVATFCAVILLWAGAPDEWIYSLDPDRQPTRIGIPFLFMVEIPASTKPVEQNAGGVVFLMLLCLNFIVNAALFGTLRNSFSKR